MSSTWRVAENNQPYEYKLRDTSVARVQHASRRAQVGGRPGQCQHQPRNLKSHATQKSCRVEPCHQGAEITSCSSIFYVPAQYRLFPSKALRDIVLYDHRRSYRRVSRDAGNHGKAHSGISWSYSTTELFNSRRLLQASPSRATLLRVARSPATHHDARSTTRDPRRYSGTTNVKRGQISGFDKLICKQN